MIVRPATPVDAAAICDIANAVIRDTQVTFTTIEREASDIVAEITGRGAAFQVAEVDGRVLGYATYTGFRGGPGYAFTREHSVQVAATARGRGIGQALMERIETVARSKSVHVLVAGISAANPRSVAFHERLGFSEVGRMPQVGFKNGCWLDLILMQKLLTPGPDAAPDTGPAAG